MSRQERVEDRLKRLVRYLNAEEIPGFDREHLDRLRAYASTWLACSSAQQWVDRHPDHWHSIQATLDETTLKMHVLPHLGKYFGSGWGWRTAQGDVSTSGEDAFHFAAVPPGHALNKLFADFLVESNDRLGVCKGCRIYFAKTKKRTAYHSQECARKTTSRLVRHDRDHLKWVRITSAMRAVRKTYAKDKISNEDLRREACVKTKPKTYVSFRWLNARVANRNRVDCEECSRLIQAFLESER